MSFISIVKKIAGVEHTVAPLVGPLVGAFVPGASAAVAGLDAVSTRILGNVVQQEVNNPQDGLGVQKHAAVNVDFVAGLELAQEALAQKKLRLAWDQQKLDAAISASTTMLNAFADLKATIVVVPIA